MKVILLRDVAKVGRKYEVKELADGFARNFIIARGLGIVADAKNLDKLKGWQAKGNGDQKIILPSEPVQITAKANDQGHLFASIHAEQITEATKKQFGIEISPEIIDLSEPLKAVGKYELKLKTTSPEQGRLRVEIAAKN